MKAAVKAQSAKAATKRASAKKTAAKNVRPGFCTYAGGGSWSVESRLWLNSTDQQSICHPAKIPRWTPQGFAPKKSPLFVQSGSHCFSRRCMEQTTKSQRASLRLPRDTTYSGYRVRCARCGIVKLTLADFRGQISDKPTQVWRCPRCGSDSVFQG